MTGSQGILWVPLNSSMLSNKGEGKITVTFPQKQDI